MRVGAIVCGFVPDDAPRIPNVHPKEHSSMKTRLVSLFALAALSSCAPVDDNGASATGAANSSDLAPNGRGIGVFTRTAEPRGDHGSPAGEAAVGSLSGNGINYHNGPVMTGEVHVYYVWYGDWTGNTATAILTDLANGLGGSARWAVNTTYRNGAGTFISNSLRYMGATTDAYSQGTALSDAQIRTVVSDAITSGRLPSDVNGVYLVLTSQDVTATSGFCTSYCGWHNHASIGGVDIKYGFIGNAARCITSCAAQTTGPNGNPGADGMASVITHELDEAVTDPDLNAWFDTRGYENADKCAWTFGTTQTASNGARYNVTLGGRQFLIQQNWANAPKGRTNGYCTMSYP